MSSFENFDIGLSAFVICKCLHVRLILSGKDKLAYAMLRYASYHAYSLVKNSIAFIYESVVGDANEENLQPRY